MAVEGWLPEELVTLILAKLPVKSVLRFKCVRKSWYSVIKSPQFIHLHRSSSSPSKRSFIVRRCMKDGRYVISHLSYETLHDLGNDIDIPLDYRGHFYSSLSAPCDGLVCITNLCDQIFICNPAMRELRSLSLPFGNKSHHRIVSVALGSDPNTGQYKLLMISTEPEAKMYDFSSDSWRDTGVVIPDPFRHFSGSAISLNGAFHWLFSCEKYISCEEYILTFHISDEVTGSIPMPDFVGIDKDLFVSSKSQLALFLSHQKAGAWFHEVCVMTEYGVKESWTKLFKIGPLSGFYCYPLSFWGEQQLLLGTNLNHELVSYDLQHQNIRSFPIFGDLPLINMFPYSENLVSVHGIGGGEL